MKSEIINDFIGFVRATSDENMVALCESRVNIYFQEGGEFYIFPRDCRDNNGKSIVVFDSEGQADIPISSSQLRTLLIEDAEALLQSVIHAN